MKYKVQLLDAFKNPVSEPQIAHMYNGTNTNELVFEDVKKGSPVVYASITDTHNNRLVVTLDRAIDTNTSLQIVPRFPAGSLRFE